MWLDLKEGKVWLAEQNSWISLDSTMQHIITELGNPNGIFEESSDFYTCNFCYLGLDIVFSSESHQIQKIIFHINPIAFYDFNRYNRCNLMIKNPDAKGTDFIHEPSLTFKSSVCNKFISSGMKYKQLWVNSKKSP